MAPMPLSTPTLHTARLRLRPVIGADADALFALHSSTHVLRYWDAPPWSDRARAERFITACRQIAEEGSGARLAIDRLPRQPFVGWCGVTRWNPEYRSASLGLLPRRCRMGPRLRDGGRARPAAVGIRQRST